MTDAEAKLAAVQQAYQEGNTVGWNLGNTVTRELLYVHVCRLVGRFATVQCLLHAPSLIMALTPITLTASWSV